LNIVKRLAYEFFDDGAFAEQAIREQKYRRKSAE